LAASTETSDRQDSPTSTPPSKEHTIEPEAIKIWHRLVQTHDTTGLNELIADDAVFYSPVVHAPQRGKKLTILYLTAAFHVFFNKSFRYVREIVGTTDAVLEFEVEIDGTLVNGVDLIKWNDQAQIVEFKVMLRPLQAINLIHEKMGEMLKSAQ
jgi:ketosteroid isomerase-like protein